MRKFLKVILLLFLFIWELLQNLVGFLYLKLSKYKFTVRYFLNGNAQIKYYYAQEFPGGLTLGEFIFTNGPQHVKHERGHVIQSRILGPFYLPVIGVDSLLHAAFHHCKNYVHFWTEKWAEKLGSRHDKV